MRYDPKNPIPPYKEEIEMLKKQTFNENLKEEVRISVNKLKNLSIKLKREIM